MYKKIKPTKTTIKINESVEGETIEMKVDRIVNSKEPIADGAPIIYTKRSDGVLPDYDIRTDRWEQAAVIAMNASEKSKQARIVS